MNEIYLFILALIIPGIAHAYVMGTYSKYKKKKIANNTSGFEAARKILDNNGLNDIYIVETQGTLSDHYDSARKTIKLSKDVFHGETVSAVAIAAHEAAHAIQDKEGYHFMKVRAAIFPVVNIGTRFSYILLLAGFFLAMMELIYAAIGLMALGLLFQLVTLPVEFNASERAKKEIEKHNLGNNENMNGINKVLKAAAYTYIAGVLATALQMLRFIIIAQSRRR